MLPNPLKLNDTSVSLSHLILPFILEVILAAPTVSVPKLTLNGTVVSHHVLGGGSPGFNCPTIFSVIFREKKQIAADQYGSLPS